MIELSAPGKAFIAGEYLAMHGGPSLVLATEPRFKLEIEENVVTSAAPFFAHADSPAGKYFVRNSDLKNFGFKFIDPYHGRGGFGASTAQFLLLFAWNRVRDSILNGSLSYFDIAELLAEYKSCAYNHVGLEPSGADLVAQYKGSFCFFEKSSGRISISNWPFQDLDLVLFYTGTKLATHNHLASLNDFDSSGLRHAFQAVDLAFCSNQQEDFVAAILQYRLQLQALGFEATSTTELLKKYLQHPGVVGGKGCGAMGSDVILLLVNRADTYALKKALIHDGFDFVLTQENMGVGVQL